MLAFLLFGFAFLAAVWPVIRDIMDQNATYLTAGEGLLWQMILPFLLLVIMSITYVNVITR